MERYELEKGETREGVEDAENKYELCEGEKIVDEYIDIDGNHVTILKDKDGEVKHGWTFGVDAETYNIIQQAAAMFGVDVHDYVEAVMSIEIEKLINEVEARKAIEEISD